MLNDEAIKTIRNAVKFKYDEHISRLLAIPEEQLKKIVPNKGLPIIEMLERHNADTTFEIRRYGEVLRAEIARMIDNIKIVEFTKKDKDIILNIVDDFCVSDLYKKRFEIMLRSIDRKVKSYGIKFDINDYRVDIQKSCCDVGSENLVRRIKAIISNELNCYIVRNHIKYESNENIDPSQKVTDCRIISQKQIYRDVTNKMNIPNSVIYVVGDVLGSWYYSHTKLNTLFGGNGFPGDPPSGNCVQKCQDWMRHANSTDGENPLKLLGLVLVEFMSLDLKDVQKWNEGFVRINEVLAKNNLVFDLNGKIVSKADTNFSEQESPEKLKHGIEAGKPFEANSSSPLHSVAVANLPTIVLITVNDNETHAVLDEFVGNGKVPKIKTIGGVTYNELGIHGGHLVVNTVCEMGAGGVGASQQRTRQAIDHWQPCAIIAVGIAFGLDETKQSIGDVLISTQIQDYELSRLNADNTVTPRGDKPSSADVLRNRLRLTDTTQSRCIADWPKVRFGLVLTGQKLVDNVDYRNSLKSLFGEAIGGEMEGIGLYVSANEAKVDWIIVKAICDWGYNKNQDEKDKWQKFAANNAARVIKSAIDVGCLYQSTIPLAEKVDSDKLTGTDRIHLKIYSDLAETITKRLQLNHWEWFSDNAVRFLLSEEFVDGVDDLFVKVNKVLWPNVYPELEQAIKNLADRANIYVKTFMKKSKLRLGKDGSNNFYIEDKLWKQHYNPEYNKYHDQSKIWEKQCMSLLVNVVVALNCYAEMVRKYIHPEYFAIKGKFAIHDEMGVTSDLISCIYIPESYIELEGYFGRDVVK